jgi:tetratricopeptide (TPR) repeat protein
MTGGLTDVEIAAFAELFHERSAADELLHNAGFPAAHIPFDARKASQFWTAVSQALAAGALPDGRRRLLTAAHRLYPANPAFTAATDPSPSAVASWTPEPLFGDHDGAAVSDRAANTPPPWEYATAYRQQVWRIAPRALLDRDEELADLAAFCTGPGRDGYVWWRADAWSGKTALLSWFVLHPPPRVWIVSFFVTARLAGQSDRNAFIDAVAEQLADLLGRPTPMFVAETTRDAHLLDLLREAALFCQTRDGRLVLVVDGLDEDRGVTGPSSHSIAGLLPADPPAGSRFIVASRPNPADFPDVLDTHPLMDPRIVRPLIRSPHAAAIRQDMQRDLDSLLTGPAEDRDLLGLIVAAGGGLSIPDLVALVDSEDDEYDVEQRLNSVRGRNFRRRSSSVPVRRPRPRPDLYVVGHEDIQTTAARAIGPRRLALYRDRLHTWAGRYRSRGWPRRTPEYLLRGYPRMLAETGDTARLVALAIDRARHDRLLAVTGGDTAALAEITNTQDLLLAEANPDLTSLARLAVHRDLLTRRNTDIPTGLPAVWAELGDPTRAEALARSITDPGRQVSALVAVATALARAGDVRALPAATRAESSAHAVQEPDRRASALAEVATALTRVGHQKHALSVLADAESAARTAPNPSNQSSALADVVAALAKSGEYDRAEALARSLREPGSAAWALTRIPAALAASGEIERAEALARSLPFGPEDRAWVLTRTAAASALVGDHDHALTVLADAETIARSIQNRQIKVTRLTEIAAVLAQTGDHGHRSSVLVDAESTARASPNPANQAAALADVAVALARTGDYDHAEIVVRCIEVPQAEVQAISGIAVALTLAGRYDRAETLARAIDDPGDRAQAFTRIAAAAVRAGDQDRASTLAAIAETTARTVMDSDWQAMVLGEVSSALAQSREFDRAEIVARTLGDGWRKVTAVQRVVSALAQAGEFDQAKNLAQFLPADDHRAHALVSVAEAFAEAGDLVQASAVAATAETAALAEPVGVGRVLALARVATAFAMTGETDRVSAVTANAEAAARAIPPESDQEQALSLVAAMLAYAGDFDRAQNVVWSIDSYYWQRAAQHGVALAMVQRGEYDRAEAAALLIDDPVQQVSVLTSLAATLAATGQHDRALSITTAAETAARAIEDPYFQVSALADVASTLARAGERSRALPILDYSAAIAQAIDDTIFQASKLADVAAVYAQVGAVDRAETLATSLHDPNGRARVMTSIAGQVDTGAARRLIAQVLREGAWIGSLPHLVRIETAAVTAISDEFTKLTS